MFETEFDCSYMFLHAYSLAFTHPITKVNLELKAKFPADWQKIFNKFKWSIA